MTREEAINILDRRTTIPGEGFTWEQINEAIDMAIAALRSVSREQVEEMWRSEWEDMRETYKNMPKYRCAQCRGVFIGIETSFCPACGAPMTDEAVQMVMERLEDMLSKE